MAAAWIDNLDVDFEADGAPQEARYTRGFVPLEVRTWCQPKTLFATGMHEDRRRDANRFVAVRIVVGDELDTPRDADAGVDGAPS
jgi:hypothetical protein